jgi:hypothetical protein
MLTRPLSRAWVLPAAVLLFGTVLRLGGQEHTTRPAYDPNRHDIAGALLREVQVDQRCRILPNAEYQYVGKKKARPVKDATVCHLESVLDSSHAEKRLVAGQVQRSQVQIAEQEYVLQNVTDQPLTFVVEQTVPRDWQVDSDPRPVSMEGSTAIFKVNAEPGQIVRLHVGVRHAKNKKA